MNDGADDSPTANSLAVAAATAVAVELTVDHPSILRPDAARAHSAASAAPLHDSSSSGQLSPVDASNGHPNPDSAANPQQVALPPPGKRYRSTPAKTFQCKGFGDCRMVFSRSEHLARHIRKHTGERPFQCHCAKQFSRLDNLRQHAQTVHADKPDLNEKMMKELTTLHTSMSAAGGTTKRANKRGKNPQADAVVPSNSNYGLNGAGARNGAGGPYDPPAPDPYANAPGAPGWQPPVGNANYVNHTGYHTQYVDGGQYAAFPLTEAFPPTPAYSHHHPHHPHHSQSYAVQHHGYAPPSAAAAVQGYDYPPHAGAQRHSDPDSPLSNGHPPASASDLASPLTPTSAHTYSAYHPHHQHQHQHQHPHSHPHQHPHSRQQQHPQHLTAATAYAGHPHGMSPVPTPSPQSFRPPLHGVRDGAGGGELYPPSVHPSQYAPNAPNGAPPTSYISGGGDAAGVGVGVPARAVVVPGEHAQLGVHRFGPGISIPTGVRGNGPPTAAAVTTPIDEQHPSAYALSGGGGGGHARLAQQQQYYHPQQPRHHPHEQQQQFEGANGGYHPAVVARPSYHHGYEDEQHHHQHQHHLAAPAGSDGAGGGRSPIEAFPNLGQSALRTAPAVSNAAAAAAQSSRAMAEYNGVGVGNVRTSSSPPFRYTLPADSSIPPVRGSPSGGQAIYTNSTHPHSHVHRGYRLSTTHHHGIQQQQQQLSANGSSSANNEDPFSFHPPPLSTSAPGGGTGAGFGGPFYRSRPATAQGTGSESRPQSRRLAIMDLCDNPGEEMYDIRPRTAGGVVQRRSGPGGGSSPPALPFAFNIVGGGGGLAPPGGGGFSSRPNSSAGRAAGLEQYAVVSGSSRPGTSAGGNGNGNGNGNGSGLALAPLRIDGSGIPTTAHGGGEEDGDGDEDADGDADGDD